MAQFLTRSNISVQRCMDACVPHMVPHSAPDSAGVGHIGTGVRGCPPRDPMVAGRGLDGKDRGCP